MLYYNDVALLGYGNWCDECNEIRDERCDIVERLRAVLASTAVVLSAREREILILRTRKTARQTARRCKIAVGAMAHLEQRVLQAQGKLRVVQGADRAFRKQLPEVGRAAVEWLATLHT